MQKYCTIIYLVRHGETDWNVKKLIQGQKDIPLNEKGKKQAVELNEKLKKIKFDNIYSSDLKRASETAKIIAGLRKMKVIESKALRERFCGIYQGVTFEKNKKIIDVLDDLRTNKKNAAGVENDPEIISRFTDYLREVSEQNPQKTILIVSHGGPIKIFLISLGFRTYENLSEDDISNLSYVKLMSDGQDFKVEKTYRIKK